MLLVASGLASEEGLWNGKIRQKRRKSDLTRETGRGPGGRLAGQERVVTSDERGSAVLPSVPYLLTWEMGHLCLHSPF